MSKTKIISDDDDHGNIWNQVCDCESFGNDLKDFLKAVEFGERKYTSIDAYVQIKKATELFGPMGVGWGLSEVKLVTPPVPIDKMTRKGPVPGHQMCFIGNFWYKTGKLTDVNQIASFTVMEDIYLDTSGDSMKKVITGMITKALSYLGWNYDVFRGRFNDAKGFEPEASQEEKDCLLALLKKIKPGHAETIATYHNKRGWLRGDVIADIKKIEDALAKKALPPPAEEPS